MNPLKTRALTREQIGQFIPNPRGIRAFEDVQEDISSQYDAVTNASFLTISSEPSLGSERVLTLAPGQLTGTDGGANTSYTLGLADTTVVPGSYGGAGKSVALAIDGKGRVTSAGEYAITTTVVAEGSNLYFTDARARAALSGSTGISYTPSTGAIALSNTAVTASTYGSATSIPSITFDAQGRATAASSNPIPVLASGTYTPTLTSVANIDASTAYACKYLRVGNIVHVAGKLDIDCTAVALTQLGISLPIASNLANDGDVRGVATSLAPESMVVRGDAANDRAELIYTAVSTANHGVSFTFTYEII